MRNLVFVIAFVLAISGIGPPVALLVGIVYGLTFGGRSEHGNERLAKILLQLSVIALGFGMNLNEVVRAGRSGFFYTAVSISLALLIGLGLGRVFQVSRRPAFLISAGTAICGGSAIAAVAPITDANEEEIAVSMSAVFILNSIALLLFPWIGSILHLTQQQFGLWCALAIHDTSSSWRVHCGSFHCH